MSKENILFGVVGLLAGLIIGFMFANSVNKGTIATSVSPQSQQAVDPSSPGVGQPTGNLPEVQAALEKAKAEPDNFEAQVAAAELYYQIKRLDGAIEYLKRANVLKPDDYEVIVHLGNASFDSKKYADAESWYSKALAKKPDDVDVRTDLGLTFMFREPADYDRAIQEFKRSLEIKPDHPQTLQNLTVAYTKKGDAADAAATLAKLETKEPSNPALTKLRADIDTLKTK